MRQCEFPKKWKQQVKVNLMFHFLKLKLLPEHLLYHRSSASSFSSCMVLRCTWFARLHRGRLGSVAGTILVPISLEGNNENEAGVQCSRSFHSLGNKERRNISSRCSSLYGSSTFCCLRPRGAASCSAAEHCRQPYCCETWPHHLFNNSKLGSSCTWFAAAWTGSKPSLVYLRSNENHGGPISASRGGLAIRAQSRNHQLFILLEAT